MKELEELIAQYFSHLIIRLRSFKKKMSHSKRKINFD